MTEIKFPYGKEKLSYKFNDNELIGVLTSSIEEYVPEWGEAELVENAVASPTGSPKLCELAKGKDKIVIIASDHTRPVPSKIIMPIMLREIRKGNPDADITILIATGCHRGTTKEELVSKFGEEIVKNENIYIHDCDEREKLVNIGTLPSGGECEINTIAYEADLLVAEGFIEPHFFAGFSGGRKSVLPGVAGRKTVLANHCSEFIASENARTGILENNPIHADMLWAAKEAKLAFIVNVVLNADKKVIFASAGDVQEAHKKGTDFLSSLCGAKAVPADIVISTNGGYPLDQNMYQAVKGMTAAEATVKKGGVIIMLSASGDGIGGDHFYHQLADEADITKTMDIFLSRDRSETVPDQWQTQIMLRVLMHASVIYISEMPDETVKEMHMIPAHSIGEAVIKAKEILGKENVTITAIPDGVAVVVKECNSMDISKIDKNFRIETNINRDDIKFYNADEAPFGVYGVFRENGKYRRMPEAVAKSVSEGVYALHSNTAGGRVRFVTDSLYVAIHAEMENVGLMPHFTYTGSTGFDMYVKNNHAKTFIPPMEIKTGYESICEFNKREMREITINFPTYSDVKNLYIGLEEKACVKEASPYRNKKPVVFYGSSITQGGCASRPGRIYQNIISRRFNYDYINLGFSGNAKGEDEMVDYIKNLDMSLFVYDYDHNAPNPEHLRNTHEKMFKAIREANPNLPIIMMSRPRYTLTPEEEERLQIICSTYESAVNAGDENVYLLTGKELCSLCGDEGTVDGCHPTDLGFFSMAAALGGLMEDIIL